MLHMQLRVPCVGAPPTDEYGIGMSILAFLFPTIPECDVEQLLMHLYFKRKFRYQSAIEDMDITDVVGDMDETGATEVHDAFSKHTIEKTQRGCTEGSIRRLNCFWMQATRPGETTVVRHGD